MHKEFMVALLENGVVLGEVQGNHDATSEWIVWEQGCVLPSTYFPIVPVESYELSLAA